jgi:hypothetical protein
MQWRGKRNKLSNFPGTAVREWRLQKFANVGNVRLTPIRLKDERFLTMIANLRPPSFAGIKIHESNRDQARSKYADSALVCDHSACVGLRSKSADHSAACATIPMVCATPLES